jgi:hypothetical protein
MYLLTIRDGLQTRHIGPYESPARAAADLDALLGPNLARARWWIHELESPAGAGLSGDGEPSDRPAALAA